MLSFWNKISTTSQLSSEESFVHRDTANNNPNIPFEFTEANMAVCDEII